MFRKISSKSPAAVARRSRATHVLPAHRSTHLFPCELLPWLLAAALLLGLTMLTLALTVHADSGSAANGEAVLTNKLPADANDFARDFFHHEVAAETQDHSLWSYHELRREDGKLKSLCVYQTKKGEIERLVAIDGHPLSGDALATEDKRIQEMISDPAQMRQQQNKQREDGEQARKLLQMFPDAFHFQYDGTQGATVRLRFAPNPKFHPPNHASQVFHHMEGTVLVDAEQQRLAVIDGRLTSEVKFFGGILGHLAKGGTFNVEQKEVAPRIWEVSTMRVHMSGRALLFKTIDVQEDERYSDFRLVPDNTSLEQAAQRLKDERDSTQALARN